MWELSRCVPDGSSKFSPENRYGYFPSASLGWNADKESWWHADGITMKLRASIGATGNQGNIGPYAYQAHASGGVNYNNTNGLGLSTPGNRDLKWETAVQQDLGIDMSFFKGALSFTADVFNKDTRRPALQQADDDYHGIFQLYLQYRFNEQQGS